MATLKSRGMIIRDEQKTQRYINNIGYFRLSAYWHNDRQIKLDKDGNQIRNNGDVVRVDNFEDETDFEDILSLYIFDRQLRIVIIDAIQRAEISVRAQIVKTLGAKDRQAHKKMPLGCYKTTFLNGKHGAKSGWDQWQDRHELLLTNSQRERFIKHEISKYGTLENLPIWVSAEVWDFGCTQHLYAGLHPILAREISAFYGIEDEQVLISWMKSFNFVRNICAHHRRMWNRRIVNQPKLIKPESSKLLSHLWTDGGQPINNNIYSVLCILQYLMRYISPRSQWYFKVIELMANFNQYEKHREAMGFPENWRGMKLWN